MSHPKLKAYLTSIVNAKIKEIFKKCPHNPKVLEAAINKYYEKREKA